MGNIHKLSAAVAAISFAAAASAAHAEEVRVFNWSDYIAPETLEKFTERTGIEVTYDVYDSNEILDAALLAGRSGYDVVVPSTHYFTRQLSAGVYQPLNHELLPNLDNLNSDAPVDSWALLFDPEITAALSEAGCGLSMLDSGDEMLSPAMAYLGLDPLSESIDDLEAGGELIADVRDDMTYFHSSRYVSDLANGDICVAAGYSGDIFQAAARAEEAGRDFSIGYSIPKEGAALWFDMMAVPADAPNTENAHAFINFILDPEIAAEITEYVRYANPNAAANEYLSDEIINDPAIYPETEVMQNLYVAIEKPQDVQRARTRIWNRVKSGR